MPIVPQEYKEHDLWKGRKASGHMSTATYLTPWVIRRNSTLMDLAFRMIIEYYKDIAGVLPRLDFDYFYIRQFVILRLMRIYVFNTKYMRVCVYTLWVRFDKIVHMVNYTSHLKIILNYTRAYTEYYILR